MDCVPSFLLKLKLIPGDLTLALSYRFSHHYSAVSTQLNALFFQLAYTVNHYKSDKGFQAVQGIKQATYHESFQPKKEE